MFKLAVAITSFASVVCAQEVAFSQPEYWEESEDVAVEEVLLEDQETSEEIVLLDEELVSDSEEVFVLEEN